MNVLQGVPICLCFSVWANLESWIWRASDAQLEKPKLKLQWESTLVIGVACLWISIWCIGICRRKLFIFNQCFWLLLNTIFAIRLSVDFVETLDELYKIIYMADSGYIHLNSSTSINGRRQMPEGAIVFSSSVGSAGLTTMVLSR